MAKKRPVETEVEDPVVDEVTPEENELGEVDFDVENEYKPDPLIPKATYHGAVTKVSYNGAQACIVWDICLHDNGGAMNDGETPVDGAHVFFRNWLPRAGDEATMTKSGRSTKRQSKINMLKGFADNMKIDMSTPQKIAMALAEQEWVGLEVDVEVDIDEYQGTFRNTVNRMGPSSI